MSDIQLHNTKVLEHEGSEEMTEAEIIKIEAMALEAEISPQIDGEDDERLAEWYVKMMDRLTAEDKMIYQQQKRMRNSIKYRKAALAWKFGALVESIVRTAIVAAGGKKKSVNFLTGRAGFRSKKATIKVVDPDQFIAWYFQQPDDIRKELHECFDMKVARKTPIVDYHHSTGDIPDGCELVEAHDSFYPTSDVPSLEELSK